MDIQTHGYIDTWMYRHMDRQTRGHGQTSRQTDEWTDKQMSRQTHRHMDRQTHEQTDPKTDRYIHGQTDT